MSAGWIRSVAMLMLAGMLTASVGCQNLTVRGQSPEMIAGEELVGDLHGNGCANGVCHVGSNCGNGCCNLPTEKDKTTLATYMIEPPDVLKVCIGSGAPCEHIVAPDGTITLGAYGSFYVTGLTIDQARETVEAQLSQAAPGTAVTIDVIAFQSKAYYVIIDRGCHGQQVHRLACTGNETVLDAVAQVPGLCNLGHKKVWIARPTPACACGHQVLPVRWKEITRAAGTRTNYQVLPGDRVYVSDVGLCASIGSRVSALWKE